VRQETTPARSSPLVSCTIALILGLFVGEAFSYVPLTVSVLSILCGLFVRRLTLQIALSAALGVILYQASATAFLPSDLRHHLDTGPVRLIAHVDGPPKHTPNHGVVPIRALLQDTQQGWRTARGRLKLSLPESRMASLQYGDRIEVRLSLNTPDVFGNPGVFAYDDYMRRLGYGGTVHLRSRDTIHRLGNDGQPILWLIYHLRETLRHLISSSMSEAPAAILMSMLIGEPTGLTPAIRDVFSASGTTHLLSVSGSHLSMIALLVFYGIKRPLLSLPTSAILRLSLWKIPSQWAALLTILPVAGYAFLAGAEVATRRSLIMVALPMVAIWIGRDAKISICLAIAALWILLPQPGEIFNISVQFSFLSVLSIILLAQKWEEAFPPSVGTSRVKNFGRSFCLMCLASVGATIGAAPLTLYYFHQFSWVSPIANLLAVPLAGLVIVPFGLLCVVLWLIAASMGMPLSEFPLAAWHQQIGVFFFKGLSAFAALPGASFHGASPPLWLVWLFYGVMGMTWKRLTLKSWSVLGAMFVLVFVLICSVRIGKNLRVTFLDVGQGDATLIEFPNGKTMLVDAGGGSGLDTGVHAVAPYLWQRRIRTIDYLVGTHPQADHMGGFASLTRAFRIGEVWINGTESSASFYREFQQNLHAQGIPPRHVHKGLAPIAIGNCRVDMLNPAPSLSFLRNINEASLVFQVACPPPKEHAERGEPFSLLMTGDIGKPTQALLRHNASDLKSRFLKIPHHGSKGSLDKAWISDVSPQAVFFSVGRHNRYGHPHPDVMAAYAPYAIYRTDRNGATRIDDQSSGIIIQSFNHQQLRPIRWDKPLLTQEGSNLKNALQNLRDPW